MNYKTLITKKAFSYLALTTLAALLFFILIYFLFPIQISHLNSTEEVVIKYADNISPAHQIVIDNFNREYKGRIRVEAISLPFDKFSTNERKELLTRSLRSKSDKLDVFAIDIIWSARFAKWAEPLENYISDEEIQDLIPQALRSCIINNTLVALPIYIDIGMLFYRRDLIQALPNGKMIEKKLKESITWEDFFTLSNSFNNSQTPFYIFPADNYEGLVCSFVEILLNQNSNFFNENPLDWESEEAKKSFTLLSDMIHKYKISPSIVTDFRENSCYDYFVNNQSVFLRGWASFPKESKALKDAPELARLIESAALPHIKGAKPISTIGGWNLMLSKYSNHKEEAAEFIRFIIKEKTQKTFYENGALLPVLTSIYQDEEFVNLHPDLIKNKQYLENGIHRPLWENYTKISDVISFYANKVLKDQLSVDSAATNTSKALISGELFLR